MSPQPAASTAQTSPEQRMLYALVGVLMVTIVVLGAVVLATQPPAAVVVRSEAVAPKVAANQAQGETPPSSAAASTAAAAITQPPAELPESEPPATAEPAESGKPRRRKSARRSPKPRRPSKSRSARNPKTIKAGLDVACIVDGTCATTSTSATAGPKAAAKKDLLPTLDPSMLRRGMAVVKPRAKACGPTHGATKGTKVEVKVRIAGATGRVVSAKPLGTHSNTPLGACVAQALRAATFPQFAKSAFGLKYGVRM